MIQPDDRAELVDGLIVKKTTPNPPRFTAFVRTGDWLRSVAGEGRHVRPQGPIALSEVSEPEPDLAVVFGSDDAYERRHPKPQEVLLLVEISYSSIDRDRRIKAPLYARAGISELWIVDLDARRIEVHRDPGPFGYLSISTVDEFDEASPLFNPSARVKVSRLLPTSTRE